MYKPDHSFADWVTDYEPLVASAARRFSSAAEYDDLYQEGMIALWRLYPTADDQMLGTAIFNRMKDWVRYVKRLSHNQSASYDEILTMDFCINE